MTSPGHLEPQGAIEPKVLLDRPARKNRISVRSPMRPSVGAGLGVVNAFTNPPTTPGKQLARANVLVGREGLARIAERVTRRGRWHTLAPWPALLHL